MIYSQPLYVQEGDLTNPIVFENVSKVYGNSKVLNSISFEVREGEILALVGSNGSGKSTVVRLSLGLKKTSSGNIKIYGEDPYHSSKIRREIGFMLDKSGIDPLLNASENLSFFYGVYHGSKPNKKEVLSILDKVGLKDHIDEQAKTFSKGMLRRLEIAKILLCEPKILILDEPFSGLDQEGREFLIETIDQFREGGSAILISSHEIELIGEIFDAVVLLHRGEIIGYERGREMPKLGNFYEIEARNIESRLRNMPMVKRSFSLDKDKVFIELEGELNELINKLSERDIKIKKIKGLKEFLEE
ncbi:MAG: ABC transporter ATP-binding protein [Euryarchaeota archaeon]|nr:ABC transporter ATP-binding protein [Euryarchaeota archaeon]